MGHSYAAAVCRLHPELLSCQALVGVWVLPALALFTVAPGCGEAVLQFPLQFQSRQPLALRATPSLGGQRGASGPEPTLLQGGTLEGQDPFCLSNRKKTEY